MVFRSPRGQLIEDVRELPAGFSGGVDCASAANCAYHAVNQSIALELAQLLRQYLRRDVSQATFEIAKPQCSPTQEPQDARLPALAQDCDCELERSRHQMVSARHDATEVIEFVRHWLVALPGCGVTGKFASDIVHDGSAQSVVRVTTARCAWRYRGPSRAKRRLAQVVLKALKHACPRVSFRGEDSPQTA